MIGAWQLPTTPNAIIDLIIALLVWALTESVGNAIMDHVLGRVFRGYVGKVPYGSTYKHFLEHAIDFGAHGTYTYAFTSSIAAGVGEEIMWFGAPLFVGWMATSNLIPTIALMLASGIAWAGIHSFNYFDYARRVRLYRYRWLAFGGAMGYYVPAAIGSIVLWVLGFGYVSIMLHTIYDLSISLRETRLLKERARLHREYQVKGRKRVSPYAGESYVGEGS